MTVRRLCLCVALYAGQGPGSIADYSNKAGNGVVMLEKKKIYHAAQEQGPASLP